MKKDRQIEFLLGTILMITDKTTDKQIHQIASDSIKTIKGDSSQFVRKHEEKVWKTTKSKR